MMSHFAVDRKIKFKSCDVLMLLMTAMAKNLLKVNLRLKYKIRNVNDHVTTLINRLFFTSPGFTECT